MRNALAGALLGLMAAPCHALNDAQFVSQNVPTEMISGVTYYAQVTFKNTGDTTWSEAALHRLGSQNPQDNGIWMQTTGRVALTAPVAPGQNAAFSFRVFGTPTPGPANFQWRMVQEGVEWFGETTPNLSITVRPRLDSDHSAYQAGETPFYTVVGAPAGAAILWSGWKNGVQVQNDADLGQTTDGNGYWTGSGPAWAAEDAGYWTRQVSIGGHIGKVNLAVQASLTAAVPSIATQTLSAFHGGGDYRLTTEPFLFEGAKLVANLNPNAIFVYLTPGYPTVYPATDFGAGPIASLKALAQTAPFQQLFSMSFTTFVVTAHSFVNEPWINTHPRGALGPARYANEKAEFHDLAEYLLQTYQGTGKTFILKNWEGDWLMDENFEPYYQPDATQTQAFTDWLNARHEGVVQARTELAGLPGVRVLDAAEFTQVEFARRDRPCWLKDVLAGADSDLMSYSSWQTISSTPTANLRRKILDDLAFIRRHPSAQGRDLLIAEYGFTEGQFADSGNRTDIAARAFLDAGIPLAFFWQIIDNECQNDQPNPPGACPGFGLFRPDGSKAPAWHALSNFLHGSTSYDRRIQDEAAWIFGDLSRPTGSFLNAPGGKVVPYFANLALTEALKADPSRAARVKQYLQWYLAHLNRPDHLAVHGTVYDYDIVAGNEVSAGSYDSSDSYAATFLSLFRTYYDVSGDLAFVQASLADLKTVAGAIDATLQATDLTYGKPDYAFELLMDNVEVWKGYLDFAFLLGAAGDAASSTYQAKAAAVRAAIETNLWKPAEGNYVKFRGGSTDWSTFYADAAANLWPIVFGLPEAAARKGALWQKFLDNHKSSWVSNQADPFPWVALAVAGKAAGDLATVESFDAGTRAKFLPGRAWTWHIGEAGFLIRLLSELKSGASSPNQSVFVSQSVPLAVTAGEVFGATVAFRNAGTLTWDAASGYKLASRNPDDNATWGTSRSTLSASVSVLPGATGSWVVAAKAPSATGTYDFQWRVLQEGVEAFGDLSTDASVMVTQPSSAAVSAAAGGTLTYVSPTGEASLAIPALAFSEAVGITLRSPASFPTGPAPAGMSALAVGLEVVLDKPIQPFRSVTIAVPYRDSDVAGKDESKLILARYDPALGWVPLLSTVDGAGNKVSAATRHLSVFQIMVSNPADTLSRVKAIPNPLRPAQGHAAMGFFNLPALARLRIYTQTGELIKDFNANSAGLASWDGTNMHGRPVASGVYHVLAQGAGGSRTVTVAVQR
ncbi:MAG: hypothetical protein HY927_06410 [Elusimicrobia bacterium]|nr:hypothetical protein [Elusimicrobiota bacterium]